MTAERRPVSLRAVESGGDGEVGAGASAVWRNREGLSRYAVRWHWVDDPEGSGFTAVLRVKDEARSLPWVLPGVLRAVDRAVVVDNGSTDGTAEVAERVARQAGLEEKLRVVAYPFAASRCGPEHLATYPDSVHSLVYFYNWSFSQARTRYSLKWDGDMVLTPEGEGVMRDLSWQLQGIDMTVRMGLSPVYVESERVAYVDRAHKHREICGWPNTSHHTFVKCFDWEFVKKSPSDYILQLPDWVCFEIKWLDKSQWPNWSRTDFDNLPHHTRKRREMEVGRALLEGAELPTGVHRIESPGDVHVIEHLRRTYREFCQRGRSTPQDTSSEENPHE